jgi:hypothetical protein
MSNSDASMASDMAGELREALETGDRVDPAMIDLAENMLHAHQVYVQLLYVGMVVDRITQLPYYFEVLDSIVETLDTEELAEATTAEKIRSTSALNMAIKTKVDVISSMMASKEAVGMITASMKDTFGDGETILEEGGASKDLLERLKDLPAHTRQRILGMAVNHITDEMKKGEDV